MMKPKLKESDIQKQIVEYLSAIARRYNFFFFSIPNESAMMSAMIIIKNVLMKMSVKKVPLPLKKIIAILINHLKKMGLIPGVPDLCILWNSKTIFIEVKKPGEFPTENQERIHRRIRETGHWVFVACSVEDVKIILKGEGVFK